MAYVHVATNTTNQNQGIRDSWNAAGGKVWWVVAATPSSPTPRHVIRSENVSAMDAVQRTHRLGVLVGGREEENDLYIDRQLLYGF